MKEGKSDKGTPRNENEVGELPSDDGTEPWGNDQTGGCVDDKENNNEDLQPNDDTEFHRNDQTKGNIMEDKIDHEESPKIDRVPTESSRNSDQTTGKRNNNSLTPPYRE